MKRVRHFGESAPHRRIAAIALGHRLPEGAEVHHVNGDPHDNRPENLVVCQDRAYHALLHANMRALARRVRAAT